MLPRDIESRFCATYGDAECGAVNRQDLIALALSQLVIKAFSNIDTGCRAAKILISCHLQTPSPGRTIGLELDNKEEIYQVLTIGNHLILHRVKLGLLRLHKCFIMVISIKNIRHRSTDFEVRSDIWNSMFGHWQSVAVL
jgi:hypothetical protein